VVGGNAGTEAGVAVEKPVPADYGPIQVLEHTGLARWQWEAARVDGLIPAPDVAGGRWSAAIADDVAARRDEIVAAIDPAPPLGGHRAADRLAQRAGLDVDRADVEALVEAGHLEVYDYFKEWPIYRCRDLDAVDAELLAPIVGERETWNEASVRAWDAPAYLGWRREEFDRVRADRGVKPGRFNRYAKADLDALAGDDDLAERLRCDRLLMSHQAAQHLEIRPTDFKYLVAADLAVPQTHVSVDITRYRSVSVPLYRTGDLEELREHPDIDWEAVRAVKPGEPSPLRHLARRPVNRAAAVRRWVAEYGDQHGIEVWAWWHPGAGQWEVDFERLDDGPGVDDVKRAIAEHPHLLDVTDEIAVATDAGAAVRWARAMREPGAAVILDTETTDLDGYAVEIGVVDAATGETLLDTLVNPGCPIEPGARMVHGISDEEVAGAPPFAEVLPQLLDVTEGRTVLAYNASFDAGILSNHAYRDGLDLRHLGDFNHWACLMGRRSNWVLRWRWLPLGGGHRALGDCLSAYELLCAMTAPPRQPKAVRR